MELKLVDIKDPVLRGKAKKIKSLDKKVVRLIKDMKETLIAQSDPEGVGLAAPQVGKSLALFLINYEKNDYTIMNPKVLKIAKVRQSAKAKKKEILEGCLSLPHYYGPLNRANKITIQYRDEHWNLIEKTFSGFLAQIVQHEIDHLNGILFVDHILDQNAPLYKFDGEEWEEVELV